jgi:predicted transcriptional regulator
MSTIAKNRMNSEASTGSKEISGRWRADGSFKTVVFQVRTADRFFREGPNDPIPAECAIHSFATWESLHRALTPNRIAILRASAGKPPMSIRALAREVGKDFKGVHSDVTWLLENAVLERSPEGKITFPHDEFRVEYASPTDDR